MVYMPSGRRKVKSPNMPRPMRMRMAVTGQTNQGFWNQSPQPRDFFLRSSAEEEEAGLVAGALNRSDWVASTFSDAATTFVGISNLRSIGAKQESLLQAW